MPRTKAKTVRVYRETMDRILDGKGLERRDFNEMTGNSRSYFSTTFAKGYADVTVQRLTMWRTLLGVSEEEIRAIPTSKTEAATPAKAETQPEVLEEIRKQGEETRALLTDGFAMIHQDIQMLIETMHRYWRSEEPKYEVIDREQP